MDYKEQLIKALNELCGTDMNEKEFMELLKAYANTTPYLDILDDLNTFILGYKNELSDKTLKMLKADKTQIANHIAFLREE